MPLPEGLESSASTPVPVGLEMTVTPAPEGLEMSTLNPGAAATPPNSPAEESKNPVQLTEALLSPPADKDVDAKRTLSFAFDSWPSNSVHMHPQETKAYSKEALYDPLFGIGFSGGGVRSASFCSGVLLELMKVPREPVTPHDEQCIELPKGVLPKYISCVSGGGAPFNKKT